MNLVFGCCRRLLVSLIFTACPLAQFVYSAELSLEAYLNQVRASHQGYQASSEKAKGYENQSAEFSLFYSPSLFANYSLLVDKKQTASASFQGSETDLQTASFGLSKISATGTQARVYYELSHIHVKGTQPALVPEPKYFATRPVAEITQPLWRNFFGSETRSAAEITRAQSLSQSFSEQFKLKQILVQAEAEYWKLCLADQTLDIRQSTLENAKELRLWAKKRSRLELADKSDLLQAEAALQVRQLELERAQQDHREARRTFNSLRGITAEEVEEKLTPPQEDQIQALEVPSRSAPRENMRALEQKAKLDRAAAHLLSEKYRSSLDLKASLAGNGRDPNLSTSVSESFGTNHPTYSIGLFFTTPLYFASASRVQAGADFLAKGSELDYQRHRFEEDREYESLSQKFLDSKRLLKMAMELENLQQEKVVNERARLRRGRTTTFQVLNFEQDYALARLNRLKSEAELLVLHAQLKTFSATPTQ